MLVLVLVLELRLRRAEDGGSLGRGEEETAVRRGNAVALMLNGSTRRRTALNNLDGQ